MNYNMYLLMTWQSFLLGSQEGPFPVGLEAIQAHFGDGGTDHYITSVSKNESLDLDMHVYVCTCPQSPHQTWQNVAENHVNCKACFNECFSVQSITG